MSELPANKNNSDEIDLGQLFALIGNAFQRFFNFIGTLLRGLFHLIILLLLFIRKNFLILLLAVLLGGIGGFFIDENSEQKYTSKMVVEPNFNSVQQLYNNVAFYNDLAKANDSVALASSLNITVMEASTINEIFVDSYSDDNQKIKLFDEFIRELDTTTVKTIDFDGYLKNFNSLDARFHQISVISTNNRIAKKIQPAIVESISDNDYFKLQKKINDENLDLQEKIYNQQLIEIDSLQKLYQKVLVKEADKPMQGTNINLAENGESQNKELALIQEREVLKTRLVRLNQERANKSSIINVISDFPERGVEQKGLWYNYKFILPLALLTLTIGILILVKLNKYLKNYNKQPKVN